MLLVLALYAGGGAASGWYERVFRTVTACTGGVSGTEARMRGEGGGTKDSGIVSARPDLISLRMRK